MISPKENNKHPVTAGFSKRRAGCVRELFCFYGVNRKLFFIYTVVMYKL